MEKKNKRSIIQIPTEFVKINSTSFIIFLFRFLKKKKNVSVSSVMSLNSTSAFRGLDRAFCVRMKSTLTKRGCHFKSSGYRVSTDKSFV